MTARGRCTEKHEPPCPASSAIANRSLASTNTRNRSTPGGHTRRGPAVRGRGRRCGRGALVRRDGGREPRARSQCVVASYRSRAGLRRGAQAPVHTDRSAAPAVQPPRGRRGIAGESGGAGSVAAHRRRACRCWHEPGQRCQRQVGGDRHAAVRRTGRPSRVTMWCGMWVTPPAGWRYGALPRGRRGRAAAARRRPRRRRCGAQQS